MASVNISLELFALAVTLLVLLCSILERGEKDRQGRLFIAMLAANSVVLLCDALTWVFEERPELVSLLYILNFLVYSLGYVMTALFSDYFISYLNARRTVGRIVLPLIRILCAVGILLVVLSQFNHMYYSFDAGVYLRGPLYWISQALPALIIFGIMLLVIIYRKKLGLHDALSFFTYGAFPLIAMLVQIAVYGVTLLYLATTMSMLTIYLMIQVEQGRKLREKELALSQAGVSIMLSQIQPHFLYNSLTAISELCDADAATAKRAVIDFSRYLRGNLSALKLREPVPFTKEREHTELYLSFEKLRFEDALTVVWDVNTDDFFLPVLTLQPLVENAVKHGICGKEDGGTVTIRTRRLPDAVEISVEDDGVGFDVDSLPAQSDRIGLENVRGRLKAQCGGSLIVQSVVGSGTTAVIRLPLQEVKI